MTVVGAKIKSGNGGTSSLASGTVCVLTATGQGALANAPTQFLVTVGTGGSVAVGAVTVLQPGYSVSEPTNSYDSMGFYSALTTTPCAFSTAPTVSYQYGIVAEHINQPSGFYSYVTYAPLSCNTMASSTGTNDIGMSATMTCSTQNSTVSYGTDNTAAFQSALGSYTNPALNSMNYYSSIGTPTCTYVPPGNYMMRPLNAAATGNVYIAKGYGCWLGAEHYNTNIFIIPNTAGDAFAWLNANKGGAQPSFGTTQYFSDLYNGNFNQAGSSFRNITIIGNRSSFAGGVPATQNGLMFYGSTQFVWVDNCVVSYLRGIGLGGGETATGIGATTNFNESRVDNCHFDNDGDTWKSGSSTTITLPSIEITANPASAQTGDASNDVGLIDIRVFDSWGPGVWVHQAGTATVSANNNTRFIQMVNFILEGSGMSSEEASTSQPQNLSYASGDLLEFGDPNDSSPYTVNYVQCSNMDIINPLGGYAALHVAGYYSSGPPVIATFPGGLNCQGTITATNSNWGRGLQLDSCKSCKFTIDRNSTLDYGLLLGLTLPTPGGSGGCSGSQQAGTPISYDGLGQEPLLSTCLDPTAANLVQFPHRPANDLSSVVSNVGNVTLSVVPGSPYGALLSISGQSSLWQLVRSGTQTAAFFDTLDSAADFVSALGNDYIPGRTHNARFCNQTGYTETLLPGTGDTLIPSTVTVSSLSCVPVLITFTSSAAATFVFN